MVLTLVAGSFAGALQAQLLDGINAVVNQAVVTRREVESSLDLLKPQLRRQFTGQPELYQQKLSEIFNDNLKRLVDNQLILNDYTASGYTLPDTVIEDAVQQEIDRYGGRTKLTKSLQAEGMTFEKFRRQIRDQFIIRVLRSKNVSQEIIISPHKIETYYLAHQDEFQLEDQIKLRMIVLRPDSESEADSVKQKALEILRKLNEGAAFSEMASVYSQGSQGKQGGDWGWIERKTLSAGLAMIAFGIKPGERSSLISRAGTASDFWFCEYDNTGKPIRARHFVVDSETRKESMIEENVLSVAAEPVNLPPPKEFYLMLVEEKRTSHVKPLSEVQDEIERTLLTQEQARLQAQYIERLSKKTYVRYF